jgi:hypothetical protein
MATMTELIAENTVWHIPGRGPLSGDHRGRDTVSELFSRLVQGSEGTFTQELHDALGSDDHAVALTRASARRSPLHTISTTHGYSTCETGKSPRHGGDRRTCTPPTSSGPDLDLSLAHRGADGGRWPCAACLDQGSATASRLFEQTRAACFFAQVPPNRGRPDSPVGL